MDYMVFYRTLEYNHATWGPQWSSRYEVVDVNPPITSSEDVDAIRDVLQAANNHKKTEIVSVMPIDQKIS